MLTSVKDSFQAYLVEGANFTSGEEYPIIPNDSISDEIPKKIMPFAKAINYQGDLSNTFICFYEPDGDFERVRRAPKRYVKFFQRTAGIIGFDFSVHSDMPIIKQKSQMNDNLSLTYYYAKQGIRVIPNIRYGIDELAEDYLEAIPNGALLAVGCHGFIKEKYKQYEWYCFLDKIISEKKPEALIVYGSLSRQIFDSLKTRTKIIEYEPWIIADQKRRAGNGVKRSC